MVRGYHAYQDEWDVVIGKVCCSLKGKLLTGMTHMQSLL